MIRLPLFAAMLLTTMATQVSAQETAQFIAVCSTTQVADFTRQVVGDRWEVHSILAPGQDPHLYQATLNDAELIASADLCLENGWHLEGGDWMQTLVIDAGKPLVTCVVGLEALELTYDGEVIPDPHAWFTPINAATYVRNILAGVKEIDPDHASEYEARASLYLEQLRSLDRWIARQINAIPAQQRVLVTSHDAFNYFCNQYSFKRAAPIPWSTGQELGGGITPERRRETIETIQEFGVRAIFVETSVNPELVREIAREAGVEIGGRLYSDSMGVVGSAGETYIGMMRENVITIVTALR